MSQEWLKQLAELSNDKDLRKRAQQMQKAQRTTVRPGGGRQRSLVGAAFGHFFRWLFLFGLAEAAAMFVVAESQDLTNESWGYIFHYVVWYALTQPVFPTELYVGLQEWFGLTPADALGLLRPDQSDPPGAAGRARLLRARRRRPGPHPVLPAGHQCRPPAQPDPHPGLLANLAVIFLFKQLDQAVIALWLGAFLFSFIGGAAACGRRGSQSRRSRRQQQQRRSQPVAAAAATGGPPGTGHGTALPSVRGRPLPPRRNAPSTSANPPSSATAPAPGSAAARAAPGGVATAGRWAHARPAFRFLDRPLPVLSCAESGHSQVIVIQG